LRAPYLTVTQKWVGGERGKKKAQGCTQVLDGPSLSNVRRRPKAKKILNTGDSSTNTFYLSLSPP